MFIESWSVFYILFDDDSLSSYLFAYFCHFTSDINNLNKFHKNIILNYSLRESVGMRRLLKIEWKWSINKFERSLNENN